MADARITILLTVRLKGLVTPEVVAGQVGLSDETVRRVLLDSVASGWTIERQGERSGYQLTEAGRRWVESALSDELEQSGAKQHVESLYDEFVELNTRFLNLCTDWQLLPGTDPPVLNDHSDAGYDASILAELHVEHDEAVSLGRRLAAHVDRLGAYGPRLDTAWRRVQAGEMSWLLGPTIDSYHTVWMEWHQDLLCTLRRRRSHP